MTTQDNRSDHPARWAAKLAGIIHAENFPNGDRAALKRMGIKGRTPLAFQRFIYNQRNFPQELIKDWNREQWRVFISGIAMQHANPHQESPALGAALSEIGFSEIRLESLLSADGSTLNALVLRVCRRLAAQRKKCNWFHIGELLFSSGDGQDRIRDRIAADFYRAERTSNQAA